MNEIEENKKELLTSTILGSYETFEDAKSDAIYCSQAEVLVHLLKGENVFLSGGAGSGKSHVIETYVKLRKQLNPGVNIVVTATTGLAALNIGGETIHSVTGLGMVKTSYEEYLESNAIKWFRERQTLLKLVDVLIIDEVSMLSAQGLDFVIDRIKHAKGKLPQIILAGDFTQLPPVATREDISKYGKYVANFCYKCRSWEEINPVTCYLDKSWRAKEQSLKVILENISNGHGRSPETIDLLNTIAVSEKVDSLTSSVLMTKNKQVDHHNIQCQKQNENEPRTFTAFYANTASENYARRMGIPDELTLKEGDRVMITQNLKSGEVIYPDPSYDGRLLANKFLSHTEIRVYDENRDEVNLPVKNGMIGTVTFNGGKPMVVYKRGGRTFYIRFFNRHVYTHEEHTGEMIYNEYTKMKEPELIRYAVEQYPLKLAYAISVHKSQGQTLDNITVDLTECWTENLGYVALSRVRSSRDITLLKRNGRLGSPKALLVSKDSLLIKEEILGESLKNRIENLDTEIEWLMNNDPIKMKRAEKEKHDRYGNIW